MIPDSEIEAMQRCVCGALRKDHHPLAPDGPSCMVSPRVGHTCPCVEFRSVKDLLAECERHQRANLVRAVMEGYGLYDEWVGELINDVSFDRVPWKVAEKLVERTKAAEARCVQLTEALRDTVKAHESITARFRAGTPKPPPEWAFKALDRARALLDAAPESEDR